MEELTKKNVMAVLRNSSVEITQLNSFKDLNILYLGLLDIPEICSFIVIMKSFRKYGTFLMKPRKTFSFITILFNSL
jgi:hypothetical protein